MTSIGQNFQTIILRITHWCIGLDTLYWRKYDQCVAAACVEEILSRSGLPHDDLAAHTQPPFVAPRAALLPAAPPLQPPSTVKVGNACRALLATLFATVAPGFALVQLASPTTDLKVAF